VLRSTACAPKPRNICLLRFGLLLTAERIGESNQTKDAAYLACDENDEPQTAHPSPVRWRIEDHRHAVRSGDSDRAPAKKSIYALESLRGV